jgi:hypothetical protein
MLNDRDRQVLEEVERELASADPLLARRMRQGTWADGLPGRSGSRPWAWPSRSRSWRSVSSCKRSSS